MATKTLPIVVSGVQPTEILPETRGYFVAHSKTFSANFIRRELELAARAGFNLVLFPVYVNGYTFFRSETAREAGFDAINPPYRRWDPLTEALDVANSLGVSVWGIVRAYNFHPRYSVAPQRLLKKFPQWRLTLHPEMRHSPLRKRENYVACPINAAYRRYLGDLLAELVAAYPIDGLMLTYSGYGLRKGSLDENPFCYCLACRERFAIDHRTDLVSRALEPGGIEQIRQWQTQMTHTNLEYLRHRIMKSRRTLRLVCRAQPHWRWHAEEAGPSLHSAYTIDWNALLGSGVIEELAIDHDEDVNPELFSARLVTDLAELHHESLLLPSIRVNEPGDLDAPLRAIHRYAVAGLIAEFNNPLTETSAALIRERFFSEPAQVTDRAPLLAVSYLLKRVQANHADNELIYDFMRDFLRLIERAYKGDDSFHSLEVIFENLTGLRNSIRRGRLGRYPVPESTIRDLGLARRLIRVAMLDVKT